MTLRTPLGRARGLGSAHEGVSHFWWQRITAVALIPVTFWFVISVLHLAGADYQHFRAWLATPGNATMMVLTIFLSFYHGQLGVQVILEDYVHSESAKFLSLIAVKFAAVLLGVFTAVAVLRVAFVGG